MMVTIILAVVKMCDIGNSDSDHILSSYFKVDDSGSGDDYDKHDVVMTVLMWWW